MNEGSLEDAASGRWTFEGRIPLGGVADGASWHRARSLTTGEIRTLFIVTGDLADEVADAARRATLVESPGLLPVLEVITVEGEEPATIVEYPAPPAPPLAALFAEGPLRPETARSIIGEAATALESARRRGLRHQQIDSNRVFVDTAAGTVSVLGVGVEAASHADAETSGKIAAFLDVTALVALLYRAMAGTSPRVGEDGTVPPPSTLTDRRLPADLDALCTAMLNDTEDAVPESTRELITELGPWQSIPVTLEAYEPGAAVPGWSEPAAVPEAAAAEPAATDEKAVSTAEVTPSADSASEQAVPSELADQTPPAERTDPTGDEAPTDAAAAAPAPAPAPTGGDADSSVSPAVVASAAAAAGAAGAPGIASAAATPAPTAAPAAPTDAPAPDPTEAPAPDPTAREAAEFVQDLKLDRKRDQATFPAALDITPAAPRLVEADAVEPDSLQTSGDAAGSGRPDAAAPASSLESASEPAPRPTPARHAKDASAQATPASASTPDEADLPAGEDAGRARGPVVVRGRGHSEDPTAVLDAVGAAPLAAGDSAGPFVVPGRSRSATEPATAAAPVPTTRSERVRDVVGVALNTQDPRQSGLAATGPTAEERSRVAQWILLGAGLAVIVALVFALTSVTSVGRRAPEGPVQTTSAAEAPSEAAPADAGAAPADPASEAAPAAPAAPAATVGQLSIVAEGGEADYADRTDRLTDGDASTQWTTKIYGTAAYGGLRTGIGIDVRFPQASTLTAVVLTTPESTGGTIELYALNEDGSRGELLASAPAAPDGEVRLAPAQPVTTTGVRIWFAQLPEDTGRDGFRAHVAELRVE